MSDKLNYNISVKFKDDPKEYRKQYNKLYIENHREYYKEYKKNYDKTYSSINKTKKNIKKREYAIYKGDKLLYIDTLENLCKIMKVKMSTILFYSRPCAYKRNNGNYKVAVRVK